MGGVDVEVVTVEEGAVFSELAVNWGRAHESINGLKEGLLANCISN